MKLSRTWKIILTLLLILSTIAASLFSIAGIFCYQNGYYTISFQDVSTNYYQRYLERETENLADAIGHNIDAWGVEKTTDYIQNFTEQTGIRIKLNYNTKPYYKNLIGSDAEYTYHINGRYYVAGKRFSVLAHLDTATIPTISAFYQLSIRLYDLRYSVWIGAGICAVLMFLVSVILIISAGLRKGFEGVLCGKLLKKMPYSILLIVFATVAFGITVGFLALDGMGYLNNVDLWLCCLPLQIGIQWLLVVRLLCLTVKKFRTKTFWNTGILYNLGKFIRNKLLRPLHRFVFAPFFAKCSYLWKNLSLWWKGGLLYLGYFLISGIYLLLFGIACNEHANDWIGFLIFCWVVFSIALGGAVFLLLINLQALKAGALKIKSGGLTEKINTSQMYWEFKQHAETLNSIGDGIKAAVAEQIKSERFQTELITNVSHDIKTPMTSIINYVDLLDKLELNDPTAKEYIAVLSRQSARLKKLTEDLVEASKAQSGALTPIPENVNLSTLLSQAIGEYTDRLEERILTPVVRLPEHEVYLKADSRMLWRIVDNLLSNICKYALTGTRVYIDLDPSGTLTLRNISREEITVADEELTRRFVRGDASRGISSGSGLGLSIALSLTELMQGNLKVHTDGDLFKVILTLPLGEKPEDPESFPEEIPE